MLDELFFHLGIKLSQPLLAAKLLADEQIHQLSGGFFLTVQAQRLTNHRNLADLLIAVAERNDRGSQREATFIEPAQAFRHDNTIERSERLCCQPRGLFIINHLFAFCSCCHIVRPATKSSAHTNS